MEGDLGAFQLFSEIMSQTAVPNMDHSMTQMPADMTMSSSWLNLLDGIYNIPTTSDDHDLNEFPDYNFTWRSDDDHQVPFDFIPSSINFDHQNINVPCSDHFGHLIQPNYANDHVDQYSFLFDDFETGTSTDILVGPMHPDHDQTCVPPAGTTSLNEIGPTPPIDHHDHGNYEGDQCMINCTDAWLVEPGDDHNKRDDQSFAEPVFGSVVISAADTQDDHMFVDCAGDDQKSSNYSGIMSRIDDDVEEEETEELDQMKTTATTSSCKNLVSERNRRKRLGQQLLDLRALVPNITKMDKRSVLVDALTYLTGIHDEIEQIKKEELKPTHNNCSGGPTNSALPRHRPLELQTEKPRPRTQIIEVDMENIEDRRFVVKITCKGGPDAGGEVLRVIESLGVEITFTALDKIKPMLMLVTIFIRVRKQGKMTEEKLKDCIISTALKSGLLLKNP